MNDASDPGLCRHCLHAAQQASRRGGAFWRCRRADEDNRFARYPPLPVRACAGFESAPAEPDEPAC